MYRQRGFRYDSESLFGVHIVHIIHIFFTDTPYMNCSLRLIKLKQVIFWGNKGWFIRAALRLFEGDIIRINPIWIDYLIVHRNILKGFTIHKLNCFLARRNPNFMLPTEMTGNSRYSFYSEYL